VISLAIYDVRTPEMYGNTLESFDAPFQKFMWGDYFSSFMRRRLVELDFRFAVDLATKLAWLVRRRICLASKVDG
jgi:hypothetical protein